jgi:hypothetical protein
MRSFRHPVPRLGMAVGRELRIFSVVRLANAAGCFARNYLFDWPVRDIEYLKMERQVKFMGGGFTSSHLSARRS